MKFFLKLFPPDLKVMADISKFLASGRYDECITYIKSVDQKNLKKSLNYYIVTSEKLINEFMMHRYKMMNDMHEMIFKEKSKYYDQARYNKCVNAANEDDKPLNFFVQKLKYGF